MLKQVQIINLPRVPDERGYLTEILRCDREPFKKFGQVYCSATYPGVIKGWHKHQYQTDNLSCIHGEIKLVISDGINFKEIFIGALTPKLVTIPPNLWHGWKNIHPVDIALVINVPDLPYNYEKPDEIRLDPHGLEYKWDRKDG